VEKQKQEDQSALEIRQEEIAFEQAQLEQQTKEEEDQKKITINMQAEGKSALEIEKFISLIYGLGCLIFLISIFKSGGFISIFTLLIGCFLFTSVIIIFWLVYILLVVFAIKSVKLNFTPCFFFAIKKIHFTFNWELVENIKGS
jgi:hypothetical protein